MKLALISSWLWVDGEYISPFEGLDYGALLTRLRDRPAAGDGVEANTVELEVDAATEWRDVEMLLSFASAAGIERVELVTVTGRYGVCPSRCNDRSLNQQSSNVPQTVVMVRPDVTAVWSGREVSSEAPAGTAPQLKRLLELPSGSSESELEAAFTRLCSEPNRCSRVVVQFAFDLPEAKPLRTIELLVRAARAAAGASPPWVGVGFGPPPPVGEEASAFVEPRSGRLPPEIIRQIVRRTYGTFRSCYERGLSKNPNLQGRVTVRFVIERDGSVSNVTNADSDLPDDDVVKCVLQTFSGVRFPPPTGGIVTVQYPIMLQPG